MLDKIKVGIIDLGINNIWSIYNAYKKIGCKVNVITEKENLMKYNIVILPGVGGYKSAIKKIADLKIESDILRFIEKKSNNYLVGICLGMQLFYTESNEFGYSKGMGLIEGKVLKFNKKICKVSPHMNWNSILINGNDKIFKKYDKKNFYFMHSYICQTKDKSNIIGQTKHNGQKFPSIVKKDNIIGFQFHPEKSSSIGLNLLESITKLI
jgi:glutamine amidotransferase